jgi:hypothetical protein
MFFRNVELFTLRITRKTALLMVTAVGSLNPTLPTQLFMSGSEYQNIAVAYKDACYKYTA